MAVMNISQAREKLPELMNEVYFNSKTFIITRRGIPMVKITTATENKNKRAKSTKSARAIAVEKVFGMWAGRWATKNTIEISQLLRKKAWQSYAHT